MNNTMNGGSDLFMARIKNTVLKVSGDARTHAFHDPGTAQDI